MQQSWKQFDRILVPAWLVEEQNKLQAERYLDDKSKMDSISSGARGRTRR